MNLSKSIHSTQIPTSHRIFHIYSIHSSIRQIYISGDRQWEPCDHRSIYWMGPNDARTNFPYLRPSAPKIENMYEKKLLGRNRYRIA